VAYVQKVDRQHLPLRGERAEWREGLSEIGAARAPSPFLVIIHSIEAHSVSLSEPLDSGHSSRIHLIRCNYLCSARGS
jgi:hypothetical protein